MKNKDDYYPCKVTVLADDTIVIQNMTVKTIIIQDIDNDPETEVREE